MRVGDADVRVAAVARLVTDHEGEHTADVPLKRQMHQVVGDRHVIVERFGQPDGRFWPACQDAEPALHSVDLLLHLANVGEVLVENSAVRCAKPVAQLRRFLQHRVQQALLLLEACGPLFGGAGLAEHPLEGHTRVDGDGQRARIVAPGERVEVGAGEPVAGAHRRTHVLGSDLDRTERRIPGHLVGDALVQSLLRPDLTEGITCACSARHRGRRR